MRVRPHWQNLVAPLALLMPILVALVVRQEWDYLTFPAIFIPVYALVFLAGGVELSPTHLRVRTVGKRGSYDLGAIDSVEVQRRRISGADLKIRLIGGKVITLHDWQMLFTSAPAERTREQIESWLAQHPRPRWLPPNSPLPPNPPLSTSDLPPPAPGPSPYSDPSFDPWQPPGTSRPW